MNASVLRLLVFYFYGFWVFVFLFLAEVVEQALDRLFCWGNEINGIGFGVLLALLFKPFNVVEPRFIDVKELATAAKNFKGRAVHNQN